MRVAGAVVRIAIVVAALLASTDAALPARYDTVIVGGRVIDGTGRPALRADVAIKDGRIVAIGTVQASQGGRTIDARNLVVAPGFIDVHTHADDLADHAAASNFVRMGVTTIVAGNCGSLRRGHRRGADAHSRRGASRELRHAHRPQHRPPDGDGHR